MLWVPVLWGPFFVEASSAAVLLSRKSRSGYHIALCVGKVGIKREKKSYTRSTPEGSTMFFNRLIAGTYAELSFTSRSGFSSFNPL